MSSNKIYKSEINFGLSAVTCYEFYVLQVSANFKKSLFTILYE